MRFRQAVAGLVLGGAAAFSGAQAAPVTMTLSGDVIHGAYPAWGLSNGPSTFEFTVAYDDATPPSNATSTQAFYLNPVTSFAVQFGGGPEFVLDIASSTVRVIDDQFGVGWYTDAVGFFINTVAPDTGLASSFSFAFIRDERTPPSATSSVALTSLPSIDYRAFAGGSGYTNANLSNYSTNMTFVNVALSFGDAASDIPEPASLALVGLGLAGLAANRRKRPQA